MKTLRYIFAAACAACLVSSCDLMDFGKEQDPVRYGYGDAVIGFKSAEYTFKESAGLVRIPFDITGSPKIYPITFDVKATKGVSDLELDDFIYFTQTEGLQCKGAKVDATSDELATVYVEFQITDDFEINENRTFTIALANVQGAELGDITSTTVIIKDNDNNPYEKLWGEWEFNGVNSDGVLEKYPFSINGGWTAEEEDANADKKLVCWGLLFQKINSDVDPSHWMAWYIDYDAENETLEIESGTVLCESKYLSVGIAYTACVVGTFDHIPAYGTGEEYSPSFKIKIPGTWSKDMNTMTFDPNYCFQAAVVNDSKYLGYLETWSNIVLKRVVK